VRVVYVYINYIFILVIMQVYRDYLSRGAHMYSSLLADFQVHNVPTHPAPLSALVFLGAAAGANPLAGSVCLLILASMGCFTFYAFSYCKPAEVWVVSAEVWVVSAFSWSLLTRGACIVNWSTVMYCFGRQSRRTPG
jgi:hypothetical protein